MAPGVISQPIQSIKRPEGIMAEEHKMGSMDISQHKSSWAGFMKMTTWGSATVIIILILMAIFVV